MTATTGLTAKGNVIALSNMRTTIFAVLIGAVLLVTGCVKTVSDRKTAGMPFIKDKVEGRYERPVAQVFDAAKSVISTMGVLINETTLYSDTNLVKTIQGKANERNVWVRVEGVEPKVTAVVVQTRTPGGGSDLDLAHEIEKRIALKLVQ
jgi:hypothetical protein